MSIKYKVNHFNFDKNKLSFQLAELVTTFEELSAFDEDCSEIDRDDIYASWLTKIGKEENNKVFASYIHQLCQFSFIERIENEQSKINGKKKLQAILKKLTKEELQELLG